MKLSKGMYEFYRLGIDVIVALPTAHRYIYICNNNVKVTNSFSYIIFYLCIHIIFTNLMNNYQIISKLII